MKLNTWSANDAIFATAEELLLEPIRAVEAKYRIFEDNWGDYIYDQLFAKYEGSSWPVPYIIVESIASIQKYVFNEDLSLSTRHFDMCFSKKRPIPTCTLPPQVSPLMDVDRWMTRREFVLLDHPVWDEMKNELLTINAEYEKTAKFYRSFMAFIGDLVERYPTVNEIIAAWPAFKYLLPKRYKGEEFPFEGNPQSLPEGYDVAAFTAFLVRTCLMEA